MVIGKQHSDVSFPLTTQVRKLVLGINSNLLSQLGFYSWILDTMCWYKEHFYSDHYPLEPLLTGVEGVLPKPENTDFRP